MTTVEWRTTEHGKRWHLIGPPLFSSLCGQWGPWRREYRMPNEDVQCQVCVRVYYKRVLGGHYR
jgi:hypothetical protein